LNRRQQQKLYLLQSMISTNAELLWRPLFLKSWCLWHYWMQCLMCCSSPMILLLSVYLIPSLINRYLGSESW
jgi:hypothetical protein